MPDADSARRILEARLQSLSPTFLRLTDESRLHRGHPGAASGAHFRLEIISPNFDGESSLARHRMVFAAAGDLAAAGIHALAIKTFAPGERSQISRTSGLSQQEQQQ